ncbi:MAG: helix-turn-helix domain-containing protein [Alphaproteobacteria bacterium]|nr:helix-turn-helix domain-containing protein [Alphaproteobacteria bacterium]
MNKIWTTQQLPEKEQFAYWREIICDTYTDLSPRRVCDGSFMGSISCHEQADLDISYITSEAQTVNRGNREISRSSKDEYFLLLQQKGRGMVHQADRQVELNVGDYTLVDTTRPYVLSFEDKFEQLCVKIPKSALHPRMYNPHCITAVKPSSTSGLHQLGLNYIKALMVPNLVSHPANEERLVQNFLGFLPIIFNEILPKKTLNDLRSKSIQLDMLYCFIEKNLANPDLSPAMAAEHLNVSVRYIHKLFENSDSSFGRTVLKSRLEKCADELGNPLYNNKSIAEIAFQWGFNDLSHFGRNFKSLYDCTPRNWRHTP